MFISCFFYRSDVFLPGSCHCLFAVVFLLCWNKQISFGNQINSPLSIPYIGLAYSPLQTFLTQTPEEGNALIIKQKDIKKVTRPNRIRTPTGPTEVLQSVAGAVSEDAYWSWSAFAESNGISEHGRTRPRKAPSKICREEIRPIDS